MTLEELNRLWQNNEIDTATLLINIEVSESGTAFKELVKSYE